MRLLHRPEARFLGKIGDHDLRSNFDQTFDHRQTNACRPSGYNYDLILQIRPTHGSLLSFAIIIQERFKG